MRQSEAKDSSTCRTTGSHDGPQDLPLPEVLRRGDRKRLDRHDVFSLSSAASSPEDVVNLYVAVCAWGTGTKAQRVARCVRPLHQKGAVAALTRSFECARSCTAIEAYRRLNTWGEDRIKYFGASFFTKWLYFSAYDLRKAAQGTAPLILDARVAGALGWSTQGWSSSSYGRYLDLAAEVRAAWCPAEPSHVVEYALFNSVPSSRLSLSREATSAVTVSRPAPRR